MNGNDMEQTQAADRTVAAVPAPARSVSGPTRVHVRVDRLQIAGLAPQQQQRFLRALERELHGVAGAINVDGNQGMHVPHIALGRLGSGITPEAAAAQVARRIGLQIQARNGEADDA